jgi:hypothetical protein
VVFDDVVWFVEHAESARRASQADASVPARPRQANLARRPFLPAERGLWLEQRRDKLRATLLRALDGLVEGLAGGPFMHDAVRYANVADAPTRAARPVMSG